MNFLAHLYLAGDDDGLRLGAMLGDFVRGTLDRPLWPAPVVRGILLHRHIDQHIDSMAAVEALRDDFEAPFRRYAGIIIDLAFDHELACSWDEYSTVSLEQFDREIRELLAQYEHLVPDDLAQFMAYADARGLFATYRDEQEILRSLKGVGRRLSRSNPLHRVDEIWQDVKPRTHEVFGRVFTAMREEVASWLEQHPPVAATAA